MKLLMPSHQSFEKPAIPPLFVRLMRIDKTQHLSRYSDAKIDFEASLAVVDRRYPLSVAFGNKLYQGISPYKLLYDHVYLCHVESVTEIQIAAPHETPMEKIW